MRRKWILFHAGIAILLITGVVLLVISNTRFQKWYRPPTAELPSADDVDEMKASLLDSKVGFQRIPEFVILPDRVAGILQWLRPGKYVSDWHPLPGDELGEIWIRTKTGREIHLRFFWTGHNPPLFTFDGIDYFLGNVDAAQGDHKDGGICLGKAVQEASQVSKP